MIRLMDLGLAINSIENFGEAVDMLSPVSHVEISNICVFEDESGSYTIFDTDGYPVGYIGTNPQGKIVHICPHINDLSKDIFAYYQNEEAEEYEDEDIMADIFHP